MAGSALGCGANQQASGFVDLAARGVQYAAMMPAAEDVRRGLPWPVGVGVRRMSADASVAHELHPLETDVLGPQVAERRRAFFALGRAAARDALGEIGLTAIGVGRGRGGEPLWPDGIVGAITHARDLAIAVVGRRTDYAGLGIDLEELARGPSARAARLVCRPSEAEWVSDGAGTERLTMLFSAKEAVFKTLYPIEGVWFGFADAELTWRPEHGAFEARVLKSVGAGYPAGFKMEVRCSLIGGLVLSTGFAATAQQATTSADEGRTLHE